MIFARVSVEVEPFLDREMIFAAHSMGETSTDGSSLELPISSVSSAPDMHVSGFGGVDTTVEDSESAGEVEADSEAPQQSPGISEPRSFSALRILVGVPSLPSDVVVLACSTSTPMVTVQLCDGNEDRSGDGGGDQLTSGYMIWLCRDNLSSWVECTPGWRSERKGFLTNDPAPVARAPVRVVGTLVDGFWRLNPALRGQGTRASLTLDSLFPLDEESIALTEDRGRRLHEIPLGRKMGSFAVVNLTALHEVNLSL